MSRIRSIKPEFWTSAQVMECSTNARLMFIGLWNFCDDAGRHADSPKQLKAEIFPADELSLATIQGMIDELSANGLITRYKVADSLYIQVDGWHHQRIDKPQKPRYPGADEGEPTPKPEVIPRTIDEPSRLIRSDTKGSDTKGSDTIGGASSKTPRPAKRCPENFTITPEMREWAAAKVPGVNLERETEAMRDWEFARARADWPAVWRTWLRKAASMNGHGNPKLTRYEQLFGKEDVIVDEPVGALA